MDIMKIAVSINNEFSQSYGFPRGFVKAKQTERGNLRLEIGGRDIEVTSDGKVIGAGSSQRWEIRPPDSCHRFDEVKQ